MLSDLKELPCVEIGKFLLRLEVDTPSSELLEIARKELRETPETQRDAIKELRSLLKGI